MKIDQRLQLANHLFQNQQFEQAKKVLVELSADNPDNGEIAFALANIEIQNEAYVKAIELLKLATTKFLNNIQPWLLMANCYQQCKQLNNAQRCYKKALKISPNNETVCFQYAGCLMSFGKQQAAIFQLNKVLKINPNHAGAMLALSEHVDFTYDKSLHTKMLELIARFEDSSSANLDDPSKKDLMKLHYALGKAADDLGKYSAAFKHWKQANNLQFQQCTFQTREMQPFFESLIEQFSINIFPKEQPVLAHSLTPVFILGMPRSGSTLLESKLLNDSRFDTIGESNIIQKKVMPLLEKMTGRPYPFDLCKLTNAQLEELGDVYFAAISANIKKSAKTAYVIDKLPANFQSIGLIKLILSKAKIIHLDRAREAVCLSIFRNYFAANEPYFCDLENLNQYYQFYQKLMTHWQTIPSIEILDVSYEDLIDDQNKVLGQIEQHLGGINLDKKEGSKRIGRVDTLSVNQVRKPLYKNSLDHWQNYSEFLHSE